MDKFTARFEVNGIKRSIMFDKSRYSVEDAESYLKNKGIQNFFFFFDPIAPVEIDDTTVMLSGEVGFDITTEIFLPYLQANKNIIIDSFGGDLWDSLKTYDLIKSMNYTGRIKIIGSCMSAATLYPLAVPIERREISDNSRFLIHHAMTWAAGNYIDLQNESDFLKAESENIAKIYAKESGKSVQEIMDIMSKELVMQKQDVINIGFFKGENTFLNNQQMTDQDKTWIENMFTKIGNSIENIQNKFSGKVKNLMVADASGKMLDFGDQITSEDQIAVGMTAKYEDGTLPVGEVVMPGGNILVFDETGTITEMKDAVSESEEMTALKSENETLKQQIADLQATQNATIEAKVKNELSQIKSQIVNFKEEYEERFNKEEVNRVSNLKEKMK